MKKKYEVNADQKKKKEKKEKKRCNSKWLVLLMNLKISSSNLRPFESPLKVLSMAPILFFHLFSFRNGTSLNRNIAHFSFAISM